MTASPTATTRRPMAAPCPTAPTRTVTATVYPTIGIGTVMATVFPTATTRHPMAEAEASHRPASQVVREFMRAFVQQQRAQREHDAFLQRKVEVARASVQEGHGRSNEDVEVTFAARRAAYL